MFIYFVKQPPCSRLIASKDKAGSARALARDGTMNPTRGGAPRSVGVPSGPKTNRRQSRGGSRENSVEVGCSCPGFDFFIF